MAPDPAALEAFGGGAEIWLRLQMAYDLAQAREHEGEIKVKRVVRRVGRAAPVKQSPSAEAFAGSI